VLKPEHQQGNQNNGMAVSQLVFEQLVACQALGIGYVNMQSTGFQEV
jgi:hypothetical protein